MDLHSTSQSALVLPIGLARVSAEADILIRPRRFIRPARRPRASCGRPRQGLLWIVLRRSAASERVRPAAGRISRSNVKVHCFSARLRSCCNNCDEVREAYVRKGWSFTNPDGIEQVRSCHPRVRTRRACGVADSGMFPSSTAVCRGALEREDCFSEHGGLQRCRSDPRQQRWAPSQPRSRVRVLALVADFLPRTHLHLQSREHSTSSV